MMPPVLEKDETFYCTLISIQVESCLFKVPRELLELYSEVFQDMFSLPCVGESSEAQDGDLDEKPLFLDGIKKDDFRAFLTALCALHHEKVNNEVIAGKTSTLLIRFLHEPMNKLLGFSQWVTALRLSHMWGFEIVKTKAISILEGGTSTFGWIDRLKLARELEISTWIRPAYRNLVRRPAELSVAEVSWMDDAGAFVQKVTKAREERTKLFLARILNQDISTPLCPVCMGKLNLGTMTVGNWSYTFWCTRYQEPYHQTLPSSFVPFGAGQNNNAIRQSPKNWWGLEEVYQMALVMQQNNLMSKDLDLIVEQFLLAS